MGASLYAIEKCQRWSLVPLKLSQNHRFIELFSILALSPVMGTRWKGGLGYDDIVSSVRRQTLPNENLEVFVKSVCERPNESSAFFFGRGLNRKSRRERRVGSSPLLNKVRHFRAFRCTLG